MTHHLKYAKLIYVRDIKFVVVPCICVLSTLNMRSALTNFEVHNMIFLTIGTMMYSKSLEVIHQI